MLVPSWGPQSLPPVALNPHECQDELLVMPPGLDRQHKQRAKQSHHCNSNSSSSSSYCQLSDYYGPNSALGTSNVCSVTQSVQAHGLQQVPLSMGFPRQEYWCESPFPPPGDLPNPGIEPASLASPGLAGGFFTLCHQGSLDTSDIFF